MEVEPAANGGGYAGSIDGSDCWIGCRPRRLCGYVLYRPIAVGGGGDEWLRGPNGNAGEVANGNGGQPGYISVALPLTPLSEAVMAVVPERPRWRDRPR